MVTGNLSFSIKEPSRLLIGKPWSHWHRPFVSNVSHLWRGSYELIMSATMAASSRGWNLNGLAVVGLVSSAERDTEFICYHAKVVTCWPAKTADAIGSD